MLRCRSDSCAASRPSRPRCHSAGTRMRLTPPCKADPPRRKVPPAAPAHRLHNGRRHHGSLTTTVFLSTVHGDCQEGDRSSLNTSGHIRTMQLQLCEHWQLQMVSRHEPPTGAPSAGDSPHCALCGGEPAVADHADAVAPTVAGTTVRAVVAARVVLHLHGPPSGDSVLYGLQLAYAAVPIRQHLCKNKPVWHDHNRFSSAQFRIHFEATWARWYC